VEIVVVRIAIARKIIILDVEDGRVERIRAARPVPARPERQA
jgi:hypothetical protein